MLVVAGPPGSGKTMFFPASVLGQVPVELGRHPRVVARPSAELSVAVGLTLPLMTHASVAGKMESRVVDLEMRYTHLERQVAELSQVVFEQQKTIDALRKQVLAVNARVDQQGEPTPNDTPPHY
jgi:uncharacterized coiled-coil protein SlyX